MSVVTYIYPLSPEEIGFDLLSDLLCANGFAITKHEQEPHGLRGWSFLLLSHRSVKALHFKLVVAQNTKTNIQSIADRFPRDTKVAIVEQAKKYVWCEIITGRSSDKELLVGIHLLNQIVALIARKSKAVVDLPENEKLYSSVGFSRYSKSTGTSTLKSK